MDWPTFEEPCELAKDVIEESDLEAKCLYFMT